MSGNGFQGASDGENSSKRYQKKNHLYLRSSEFKIFFIACFLFVLPV